MPGNVAAYTVTAVAPYSLSSSHEETRTLPMLESRYPDGRYEAAAQATVSRKGWKRTKRMTYTEYAAFRDFWEDQQGPLIPFFWFPLMADYDAFIADPGSTVGKWSARFDGSLTRSFSMGRVTVGVGLMQVD